MDIDLQKEYSMPFNPGDKVLLSHSDRPSKDVVTFCGQNEDGTYSVQDTLGNVTSVVMDRLSPYALRTLQSENEITGVKSRSETVFEKKVRQIPTFTHRRSLLEEATTIITKDRNNSYGEPDQDFTRIAELWSTYLNHEIKPHDVATMMILLKVSRLSWNPGHKDSWLDIAGYAACGYETHELRK